VTAHLTVRISDGELAVPVARVREIMRAQAITRVPRAARALRGLTALRGRLLAVIDPAVARGDAPTPLGPAARILVIETAGRVLGVLVAAVGSVVDGDGGRSVLDLDAMIAAPAEAR
jgi:purine-binding chemotaxis protein CheW